MPPQAVSMLSGTAIPSRVQELHSTADGASYSDELSREYVRRSMASARGQERQKVSSRKQKAVQEREMRALRLQLSRESLKEKEPSDGSCSALSEARSTISSPGKVGLRARLHKRMARSGRAASAEKARKRSPIDMPDVTANNGLHRLTHLGQEGAISNGRKPCEEDHLLVTLGENSSNRSMTRTQHCLHRDDPFTPERETKPNTQITHEEVLLRLSRQVRYGRRGGVPAANRTNVVRLHIYDLMESEAYVQLLGCQFPIGKCFNIMNSGLHALGTGAYHCGIEVNGVEYAFGANSVHGLSGVFTCVPKMSPGYEFRTTLEFGEIKTMKRTWICVPSERCLEIALSGSLTGLSSSPDTADDETTLSSKALDKENASKAANGRTTHHKENSSKTSQRSNRRLSHSKLSGSFSKDSTSSPERCLDSSSTTNLKTKKAGLEKLGFVYREVETFVEGHAVMQQMASEYMGVDYDLLRKNCCTFARDACLRLGVHQQEIPTWFLNIAEAGAVTEDTLTSMENTLMSPIKKAFSNLLDEEGKRQRLAELENTPNGFEVIAKRKRDGDGVSKIEVVKVVETTISTKNDNNNKSRRCKQQQQHQRQVMMMMGSGGTVIMNGNDEQSSIIGVRETLSWTY